MNRTVAKTSLIHSLRIDTLEIPGGGAIGMSMCPGRKDIGPFSGQWDRDLETDLRVIKAWGATGLVSLLDETEFRIMEVEHLPAMAEAYGMEWFHLPIREKDVPRVEFDAHWTSVCPSLVAFLKNGSKILLHCRDGLGRTGTVAAMLLIELGTEPFQALRMVRAVRSGAIENLAQERYVLHYEPWQRRICTQQGSCSRESE